VDLAAARGSITVILGPSGCGKSTLLRIVAGIEPPDAGAVYLAGRDITAAGPAERNVAMVFQDYALYPHMSAEKNMTFGLIMRGMTRRDAKERAAWAARLLGIEGLLKKKPGALSGGERQRLAVGRAIVKKPSLFLMDEPLSNVDAQFKAAMRVEITRLIRTLSGTMIWVTHDQVEAMAMADVLAVMKDGAIEAVGPPRALYERPPSLFVAGFLGNPPMNVIHAGSAAYRSLVHGTGGAGRDAIVGVRPEDIRIGRGSCSANVLFREDLGFETRLVLGIGDGAPEDSLTARLTGEAPEVGGTVRFSVDRGKLHFFDPVTSRRQGR
jgi:ABC-type sugar transport system ATPase subunit